MGSESSVAILIVCHNGRDDIEACLASLSQARLDQIDCTIWVIDNASTDGSRDLLAELSGNPRPNTNPKVRVEFSDTNLGFAGANNRLWELVNEESPETDFLYLLNQDTEVDPQFIRTALAYLQRTPQAGCVQSLLRLDPPRDQINTAGNVSHFLGFGLMTHYLEEVPRSGSAEHDRLSGEIGYASGAALLISTHLVREVGLFQSEMFMYLEDADLGWKLRQSGSPPHLCANSHVYHKYTFNEDFRFYEQLERNRLWLVLTYYKMPTLMLMLPAIVFMEAGQLLFSISNGLFTKKLRSYGFFLRPRNLGMIRRLRLQASQRRTISDREFLASMSGTIKTPQLDSKLLRYVANPLLDGYLRVLRRIVVW